MELLEEYTINERKPENQEMAIEGSNYIPKLNHSVAASIIVSFHSPYAPYSRILHKPRRRQQICH